jgi:hypothetical protein
MCYHAQLLALDVKSYFLFLSYLFWAFCGSFFVEEMDQSILTSMNHGD